MTISCLTSFVVLSSVAAARALTLEANETGTGGKVITYWQTDWGSYDRENYTGKRLRVLVRDVSRKVPAVDVDVYFVARPLPAGPRFIYAHHHEVVKLNRLIDVEGAVVAPDLKSRVLNLALLGARYSSGAEIDGWIVIGTYQGKRFGIRAASQVLLEIAEGNPRQVESFEQMVAEHAARSVDTKARSHKTKPTRAPPVVAPAPPVVAQLPPQPTPAPRRIVAAQYLTLTQPVEIKLPPYGSITLATGTKLEIIDQKPDFVKVRYANLEPTIPISSTDLGTH